MLAGYESNVLVRQLLETAGHGRVLVVDGGGSLRWVQEQGLLPLSLQLLDAEPLPVQVSLQSDRGWLQQVFGRQQGMPSLLLASSCSCPAASCLQVRPAGRQPCGACREERVRCMLHAIA